MSIDRRSRVMGMSIRAKILSVVTLLGASLIVLATVDAVRLYSTYVHTSNAIDVNRAADQLLTAAGAWAVERGTSASILGNPMNASDAQRALVIEKRNVGNEAYKEALTIMAHDITGSLREHHHIVQDLFNEVETFRARFDDIADAKRDRDFEQERIAYFDLMTNLIDQSQNLRVQIERKLNDDVPAHIVIEFNLRHHLWGISEYSGRERGILAGVIAADAQIDPDLLERLSRISGRIHGHWDFVLQVKGELSPEGQKKIEQASRIHFERFQVLRNMIVSRGFEAAGFPMTSEDWFNEATKAIQVVLEAQRLTAIEVEQQIHEAVDAVFFRLVIDIVVLILTALGLSICLFIVSNQVVRPLTAISAALDELAKGNLDTDIPGTDRKDEIGVMAQGLAVFKSYASRIKSVEEDQAEARRNAEDARERAEIAQEQAESAAQAKATFLANMSHEIRTPLNGILGLGHLLSQTKLAPKQHEYMRKIMGSGEILLGVINDILDFSKIESGQLVFESIDFNLDVLLGNISDLFLTRLSENKVELILRIDPNIPLHLVGDPTRLQQVLVNLLSNAFKFTEKGEIVVNVTPVSVDKKGACLQFAISDTGIGMTEDQQALLFQSFSQADTSTTRRFGGTGLGLVISKSLVEHMAGKIWVESRFDEGSTFFFTAEFGLSTAGNGKTLSIPKNLHGLSILVVDDNQTAQIVMQESLTVMGFEVDVVGSGVSALRKIEQGRHYDIILSDYMMPGMNGIELARLVPRNDHNEPRFILVSALPADQILDPVEPGQITAYLTKPLNQSNFYDMLMQIYSGVAVSGAGYHKKTTSAAERSAAGMRVLLVEDNEINREVAIDTLAGASIHVETAENGLVAFTKILSLPVDYYNLILMDIQMPEMDGITATQLIREQSDYANLPILAMTAHALPEEKERCFAAGMQDHISKPFDPHRLFERLVKWGGETRHIPETLQDAQEEASVHLAHPGTDNVEIVPPMSISTQSMTELQTVDIDKLLQTVKTEEKLHKYLGDFFKKEADGAALIRQSVEKHLWIEAGEQTHRLKGVSGSLRLGSIYESLSRLTDLLRMDHIDQTRVEEELDTLDYAMLQTKNEVLPFLEAASAVTELLTIGEHPPTSEEFDTLHDRLLSLKEALEQNDLSAEDILLQMKSVLLISAPDKYEILETKISEFEYEDALDIVSQLYAREASLQIEKVK